MKNNRIQQVKTILEMEPIAFQESINRSLKELGDSLISLDIITPVEPGTYAAVIVYWADCADISTA